VESNKDKKEERSRRKRKERGRDKVLRLRPKGTSDRVEWRRLEEERRTSSRDGDGGKREYK
jgi:hypothetical protein